MNIGYEEAWKKLCSVDNIMLLTHRNPDGDAVGSLFGLYRQLKKNGKNVRCLIDDMTNSLRQAVDESAFDDFTPDCVVTVDVADIKLLTDEHREAYGEKVFLSIDHHGTNKAFAEYTLLDASAAAACEVLFDLFTAVGQEIDAETAKCLYIGISTDTGCFRYPNTSAKTLRTAAELVDRGINNGEINRIIFETKTKEYAEFEKAAMNSLKTYLDGRCAIMTLSLEMFERCRIKEADIAGISALPRQIEGVEVGVVLKERENGAYKISMRSNEPVSVADICAKMGGGGHKLAAGCDVRGTEAEVTKTVLRYVTEALCGSERS